MTTGIAGGALRHPRATSHDWGSRSACMRSRILFFQAPHQAPTGNRLVEIAPSPNTNEVHQNVNET
jgi:hypothetical protein